jgi:hypothetical protein
MLFLMKRVLAIVRMNDDLHTIEVIKTLLSFYMMLQLSRASLASCQC